MMPNNSKRKRNEVKAGYREAGRVEGQLGHARVSLCALEGGRRNDQGIVGIGEGTFFHPQAGERAVANGASRRPWESGIEPGTNSQSSMSSGAGGKFDNVIILAIHTGRCHCICGVTSFCLEGKGITSCQGKACLCLGAAAASQRHGQLAPGHREGKWGLAMEIVARMEERRSSPRPAVEQTPGKAAVARSPGRRKSCSMHQRTKEHCAYFPTCAGQAPPHQRPKI